MTAFLLFTWWAPLAAMGDVAVGERRVGADRPAKSAVLGLIAAALGIERREEAAHAALASGYGQAVRVDAPGALLEDYHTVQAPPARRGKRWPTRADELAESRLGTILSLRDYRTDTLATIVLWARPSAPLPLARLSEALSTPTFVLYAGRKACPLGLPPAPCLIEAATLDAAFAEFDGDRPYPELAVRRRLGPPTGRITIFADTDAGPLLDPQLSQALQVVQRRDAIASRRRWQFEPRDELVIVAARPSGTAG